MFYHYKFKNQSEKEFIEKYFNVDIIDFNDIYYSIFSIKERRKIKLLILQKDEISDIIQKIINNSVIITAQEMLESQLSYNIAKEIDKEIIKGLRSSLSI